MDEICITIHDLTSDGNILFASDSITDILGYQPREVLGRSCFGFFHPDELPLARAIYSRGILLDKAAVLHYARILSSDGRWVICECCFTIVHDVLIASTSVYCRGERSQRRAHDALQIRRLFACSSRDPRYHMLEYLSPKFRMPSMDREPRAAFILNRFTRDLTIMFSTRPILSILGIEPDGVCGNSFYDCIHENCLDEVERCLEAVKANDSIAYFRFWSKDPRRREDHRSGSDSGAESDLSDDDEHIERYENHIGPSITTPVNHWHSQFATCQTESSNATEAHVSERSEMELDLEENEQSLNGASFPIKAEEGSVRGCSQTIPSARVGTAALERSLGQLSSIELEAVVSCTSDGLIVVLRRARPPIPMISPPQPCRKPHRGVFAAPWGYRPLERRLTREPSAFGTSAEARSPTAPVLENCDRGLGHSTCHLMASIRDVATFAWALVGVNSHPSIHCQGTLGAEASSPTRQGAWSNAASRFCGRCETCGQELELGFSDDEAYRKRSAARARTAHRGASLDARDGWAGQSDTENSFRGRMMPDRGIDGTQHSGSIMRSRRNDSNAERFRRL